MHKRIAIAVALAALLAVGPASAAKRAKNGAASIALGQYDPDIKGYAPARTAALRFSGRPFGLWGLVANLEIELATDYRTGETAQGRAYGFTSYGGYLRARTRGSIYILGRYGFARNHLEIDDGPSERDTQQRVGVGFGVRWSRVQLEVTAGRYEQTNDLPKGIWINAGLRF